MMVWSKIHKSSNGFISKDDSAWLAEKAAKYGYYDVCYWYRFNSNDYMYYIDLGLVGDFDYKKARKLCNKLYQHLDQNIHINPIIFSDSYQMMSALYNPMRHIIAKTDDPDWMEIANYKDADFSLGCD